MLFTGSTIYGEELSDVVAGIQVSVFFMELVNWIAETEDAKMSREKSIFEQMGGTYTEIDGILYPNICVGQEQTETMQDVFAGKYGDLWKKYMKENQLDRYYHLVRAGQLKQKAAEINEEANEMSDWIMQQYLRKHKPRNPDSTMEMWKLSGNITGRGRISIMISVRLQRDMKQPLQYTECRYKQIENYLLRIWEKIA